MKNSRILRLVTVLLALGSINPMEAEKLAKDGYPSMIFWQKAGPGQSARFVLHEVHDIRLLFCNRKTLKDRIRRSVCVVDDVRRTLNRDVHNAAKEFHIDKVISVGELLKKAGLENWDGGQPQVRVVKRNAIRQSPMVTDTAPVKEDLESFLNHEMDSFLSQKLEPGDFLIIALII